MTASAPQTFVVSSTERGTRMFDFQSEADSATLVSGMGFAGPFSMSKARLEFEASEKNHPLVKTPYPHFHGFFNALTTAHHENLPLVLSPDDLWLLIASNVRHFLENTDSNKYHKVIINHGPDPHDLDDAVDDLNPNEDYTLEMMTQNKSFWAAYIKNVCRTNRQRLNENFFDLIAKPFSTGGPIEKVALRLAVTGSVRSSLEVELTACGSDYANTYGIPEITLTGSCEDYEAMVQRAVRLAEMIPHLSGYFERIGKHLAKMVDTKKGNVDVDWWCCMVAKADAKPDRRQPILNGWIADFMWTFDERKENRIKCLFGYQRGPPGYKTIEADEFAVSRININLIDKATGKSHEVAVCTGFVGVSQDRRTKAIRPSIGWFLYFGSLIPPTPDDFPSGHSSISMAQLLPPDERAQTNPANEFPQAEHPDDHSEDEADVHF